MNEDLKGICKEVERLVRDYGNTPVMGGPRRRSHILQEILAIFRFLYEFKDADISKLAKSLGAESREDFKRIVAAMDAGGLPSVTQEGYKATMHGMGTFDFKNPTFLNAVEQMGFSLPDKRLDALFAYLKGANDAKQMFCNHEYEIDFEAGGLSPLVAYRCKKCNHMGQFSKNFDAPDNEPCNECGASTCPVADSPDQLCCNICDHVQQRSGAAPTCGQQKESK